MCGLVLPIVACISATISTGNVRVTVEIVIAIDSDIVVAPPGSAPPPTTAPGRPHGHTHTERNRHSRGVVPWWRIVNGRIGINWRPVHHNGIVGRYINDLRVGLFDHDHALAFDDFGFHLLLFG
jgi:hypothetical protein